MWCKVTNLTLNTTKTKELVMDLRKHKLDRPPLIINGDCMERIQSFKYLVVHITDNISWSANTAGGGQEDAAATPLPEGAYCITVWYCGCTAADRRQSQGHPLTNMKVSRCGTKLRYQETPHTSTVRIRKLHIAEPQTPDCEADTLPPTNMADMFAFCCTVTCF